MENQSKYSLRIGKINKSNIFMKLIKETDSDEKVIFEVRSKRLIPSSEIIRRYGRKQKIRV